MTVWGRLADHLDCKQIIDHSIMNQWSGVQASTSFCLTWVHSMGPAKLHCGGLEGGLGWKKGAEYLRGTWHVQKRNRGRTNSVESCLQRRKQVYTEFKEEPSPIFSPLSETVLILDRYFFILLFKSGYQRGNMVATKCSLCLALPSDYAR